MAKLEVVLTATTAADTSQWSCGLEVFRAFCSNEKLTPEVMTEWGRKSGEFSPELAKAIWEKRSEARIDGRMFETPIPFGWKRAKTLKYSAEILHSFINLHSSLTIGVLRVYSAYHKKISLTQIFPDLVAALRPEFAMCHLLSRDESYTTGTPRSDFISGLAAHDRLYDLPWMFFCDQDLFSNREKIQDYASDVLETPIGPIFQMSDEISDCVDPSSDFLKLRDKMMTEQPDLFQFT